MLHITLNTHTYTHSQSVLELLYDKNAKKVHGEQGHEYICKSLCSFHCIS